MTGKRAHPHAWWARRETLLAAGGTALAVWLVAGAWMLLGPRGDVHQQLPQTPVPAIAETGRTTGATVPASPFDPGTFSGRIRTPSVRPAPTQHTPATGATTAAPAPTATPTTRAPAPSGPPSPTATTIAPGPGHGHGHGHGRH